MSCTTYHIHFYKTCREYIKVLDLNFITLHVVDSLDSKRSTVHTARLTCVVIVI